MHGLRGLQAAAGAGAAAALPWPNLVAVLVALIFILVFLGWTIAKSSRSVNLNMLILAVTGQWRSLDDDPTSDDGRDATDGADPAGASREMES